MIDLIFNDIDELNIDIGSLRDKKILITGASGIVGVYLVSFFQKHRSEFNIEIFTWTKNPIESRFSEVFFGTNNFLGDITDITLFDNLPIFDLIIHASGYGQPLRFMEDKIKTIELNTTSTINLFKKLKSNGKFLFISTSEIYSGNNLLNIDETQIGTTNTNHSRSCYIEGKRTGESICFAYKELGYDVKIARLCLAYGPGTKKSDQRVLNSLIEKSLTTDNITLLDDGSAIRTYCYITDVIEMLINIILFGKETVYNVGGLSKTSILELANYIGDLTNKKVFSSTSENGLKGNPNVVNISIERYCKEFNKTNFVELREGLMRTLSWQKKLYTNE